MVYSAVSMSLRMSSTFKAVVRGPSFTGFGNRPVLIPAHHAGRPTAIGTCGARIDDSRTKPDDGRWSLIRSFTQFGLETFMFNPCAKRRRRRRRGIALGI